MVPFGVVRLLSSGTASLGLLLDEGSEGRPGNILDRPALDMTNPLAGALDDAGWIVEQGPVGELDIDVGAVRNQPDGQATHADATGRTEAEGEDAIGEVDLLLSVGHHLARQRVQGPEDVADRAGVRLEEDGEVRIGHDRCRLAA